MQHNKLKSRINPFKRRFLANTNLARTLALLLLISAIILATIPVIKAISALQYYASEVIDSTGGRTNVAILGIGGGSHESPNLTDTIIVLSVDTGSKSVSLISVPRDLWLTSLKSKINMAYQKGLDLEGTSGGLNLSKSALSETLGIPIHYAAILDFSLFKNIIDRMGGVDIEVTDPFVDKEFPILGKENDNCNSDPLFMCRYETVEFKKGMQYFDGSQALKYVRSRHSEGEEGTDFARSKRQQQVITAIFTKLKSKDFVYHPLKYYSIFQLVKNETKTDITSKNYINLTKFLIRIRNYPLQKFSITQDNVLYHPPVSEAYQKQWILLPKGDNLDTIHKFVSDSLKI